MQRCSQIDRGDREPQVRRILGDNNLARRITHQAMVFVDANFIAVKRDIALRCPRASSDFGRGRIVGDNIGRDGCWHDDGWIDDRLASNVDSHDYLASCGRDAAIKLGQGRTNIEPRIVAIRIGDVVVFIIAVVNQHAGVAKEIADLRGGEVIASGGGHLPNQHGRAGHHGSGHRRTGADHEPVGRAKAEDIATGREQIEPHMALGERSDAVWPR